MVGCIGLALSLATCGGIHKVQQLRARESAARENLFPLAVATPLIFHVRHRIDLVTRGHSAGPPLARSDSYFTRSEFEAGNTEGSGRCGRSTKCSSLEIALRTHSSSNMVDLVVESDWVSLKTTPPARLLPRLALNAPQSFEVDIGPPQRGAFHGWPLFEVAGLADDQRDLFKTFRTLAMNSIALREGRIAPRAANEKGQATTSKDTEWVLALDENVMVNPMPGERVKCFQTGTDGLPIDGALVTCARVEYSGHLVRGPVAHAMEGTIWLAPGLGPVKEVRTVRLQTSGPVADARRESPETCSATYESKMTKSLAHPRRLEDA